MPLADRLPVDAGDIMPAYAWILWGASLAVVAVGGWMGWLMFGPAPGKHRAGQRPAPALPPAPEPEPLPLLPSDDVEVLELPARRSRHLTVVPYRYRPPAHHRVPEEVRDGV